MALAVRPIVLNSHPLSTQIQTQAAFEWLFLRLNMTLVAECAFFGLLKQLDKIDAELAKPKNPQGIFQKWLRMISINCWLDKFDEPQDSPAYAWWCGVRAIEEEIKAKVVAFADLHGIENYDPTRTSATR